LLISIFLSTSLIASFMFKTSQYIKFVLYVKMNSWRIFLLILKTESKIVY